MSNPVSRGGKGSSFGVSKAPAADNPAIPKAVDGPYLLRNPGEASAAFSTASK